MVLILPCNEVFFGDFCQVGLTPYCEAIIQGQGNQISQHLGETQKRGLWQIQGLALGECNLIC